MKTWKWLLLAPVVASLGASGVIGAPGSQPYLAYFSDTPGSFVAVVDMRTVPFTFVHSFTVNNQPRGIAASALHHRAYVACTSTTSTIDVIDTDTNVVIPGETVNLNGLGYSSPAEMVMSP